MEFAVSLVRALIGLSAIIGIALLFSEDRRKANWRLIMIGVMAQILIALLVLQGDALGQYFAPLGWPKLLFSWISSFFVKILQFTTEGAQFVLGDIALPPNGSMDPGTPLVIGQSWGTAIAFQVLPTIIFFASFMAILYHLGIMQWVVKTMARVAVKLLRSSGAESLSVAANVFVGQTEAPLVIRPYLEKMTRSEVMTLMSAGMSTMAGGVMAAYIAFLAVPYAAMQGIPLDMAQLKFAEHLLGASLMAAPAAIILSKIIIPETGQPLTLGRVELPKIIESKNAIDAAATGARDGLQLVLNISAILLAFIALLAMIDFLLEWGGGLFGADLTLGKILGWGLAPIAWLIGIPTTDIVEVGSMLGYKIVANEFVAYLQLADTMQAGIISQKSITMATFALCGFANFSSIAIQIGGIGPLAPNQRPLIAELGIKAVIAGTLANLMTATLAGVMA
ncbi:MAG: NupC/NupG family nucleoside CNT transporter [Bacteroidetes bacterium]|nr:NupC/NupG family nucleoside CNT transporter [Bacteroidota bacterium]MCY4206068.1 NupC/NupG family nucleoside CNT transporter [Bacteroidota bacterium]